MTLHEIGQANTLVRQQRASTFSKPKGSMPAAAPNGHVSNGAADGDGQFLRETQHPGAIAASHPATPERARTMRASKPRSATSGLADTPNRRAVAATEPSATSHDDERARTRTGTEPISLSSGLAHPIGKATKPARKGRANYNSTPKAIAPSPEPLEIEAKRDAGTIMGPPLSPGGGHGYVDTQRVHATAEIVAEIVEKQKIRRFCIKSQSRCNRSIEALLASVMGYRGEATPEKARKAIFKAAADLRKRVEKNVDSVVNSNSKEFQLDQSYLGLILASADSRRIWDDKRHEVEKKMTTLAGLLPVSRWACTIPGFGLFNLAIVCGEAGIPVGDYRTVSGLWKRCGLAVISGERQRKKTDQKAAEAHGYNPKRRAEVYVVGSVSVFLAQRKGMNYRRIYDWRRNHTAPRIVETVGLGKKDPLKWTLGRCDNDARRVMTKELLKDLWVEWRRLDSEIRL